MLRLPSKPSNRLTTFSGPFDHVERNVTAPCSRATTSPPRALKLYFSIRSRDPRFHRLQRSLLQSHPRTPNARLPRQPSSLRRALVRGGSTARDKTILRNKTTLHVPRSLYEALQELWRSAEIPGQGEASKVESKFIWADALCIDQANNDERTQEVRMMEEIYRHSVPN
jgi:Heterokaryon incompatibility protein (HET)